MWPSRYACRRASWTAPSSTLVLEGAAVLGDVDRRRRVPLVDVRQQPAERVGHDRPAHLGDLEAALGEFGRRHVRDAKLAAGPRLDGAGEGREVVVDAQEVERRGDLGQVGADRLAGIALAERLQQVGRVAAPEERVQEPAVRVAVVAPRGGLSPRGCRRPARA